MDYINIKSSWFTGKENKYKSIGYLGFSLYLELFRFRLHNENDQHTFIASLGLLRKVTGYPTEKVYELIRLLVKEKVIDTNVTRWDRMYNDNGKLNDDKVMIIHTTDYPEFIIVGGKRVPKTAADYNFHIYLKTIQYYKDNGLGERCYGIHCLMRRLSNNNEEKAWMTINNMADTLGFGDNNLSGLIREMNKKYVLATYYREREEEGKKFEHHILADIELRDEWMKTYKDDIDKNIKKWSRKLK